MLVKFEEMQFSISLNLSEGGKDKSADQTINVTLTECEVDHLAIAACVTGGISPRVRLQGQLRKNGVPEGHIVVLTWAEWFGKANLPQIAESDASIAARAARDPAFRARMLEMMAAFTK